MFAKQTRGTSGLRFNNEIAHRYLWTQANMLATTGLLLRE